MKLSYQLLLIGLLSLVLPWSAWQYLKSFDRVLRDSQSQALLDQAALIAGRLATEPDLLLAPFVTSTAASQSLYAYGIKARPLVDGYDEEWRYHRIPLALLNPSGSLAPVTMQVAFYDERFYFFLKITDNTIRYYNPLARLGTGSDHLLLQVPQQRGGQRSYWLRTSAPGKFFADFKDDNNNWRQQTDIKGVWQENTAGYQVEFSVAADLLRQGFSLTVTDSDAKNTGQKLLSDNFNLIRLSDDLQEFLQQLSLSDTRISVLNEQRWLVGFLSPPDPHQHLSKLPWLVTWMYQKILQSEQLTVRDAQSYRSLLTYPEISQSLVDGAALRWYRVANSGLRPQTLASVAVPIKRAGQLSGFVLLEKTTDQLIRLTSSAFSQLFFYTLGSFVLVVVILLIYASWLSLRVRRLNQAATQAVNDRGLIEFEADNWPEARQPDEIGDLSRGYRQLLLRLQEYNDYLRTLSGKLSHELRTPIAVVKSSLENLAQVDDAKLQQQYCQRAQQGVDRLNAILNAMSSANRIEETIATVTPADFEAVDLANLLQELISAYQDTYLTHTFTLIIEGELSAETLLAKDLFIQMMDKLIDNAVDFSPPEETIVVRLSNQLQAVCIQVENAGPLLPDAMQHRLFESMVSVRGHDSATHLGLGLYIVRLIVELHGGDITATNRDDNQGVIFSITLSYTQ